MSVGLRRRVSLLVMIPSLSITSTGSTRMSTNNGAIDHQIIHIWIIDKMLMHLLKGTVVTPVAKPLVDAVPSAVILREQSPLCTASAHPKKSLDEPAATFLLSNIHFRAGAKELEDL
jgi:hypothetical protein